MNISKNTVKKYVDNLCEKRLIDVEYTDIYTKDGKKLNGNLMYTIRPIQEAIDYDLEKLFEKNETGYFEAGKSNGVGKPPQLP